MHYPAIGRIIHASGIISASMRNSSNTTIIAQPFSQPGIMGVKSKAMVLSELLMKSSPISPFISTSVQFNYFIIFYFSKLLNRGDLIVVNHENVVYTLEEPEAFLNQYLYLTKLISAYLLQISQNHNHEIFCHHKLADTMS